MASLDANSSVPESAKVLIKKSWASCQDCDGDEFLTQALALFWPEFRAGLDAYHAENYVGCAGVMADLRTHENPFVATHAGVYEIKALVASQRLLEAGGRIEELLGGRSVRASDVAVYTHLAPELGFLRGFCALADLRYDEAAEALSTFVDQYPDSSPRLVVAAQQMIAELQNRLPEQIGEVCDLMNYSARRLGHEDLGEPVQTRQQRIIELLDKLIEEAESQESSSSSSSGGSSGGGQGSQSPSNPMQQSQLPGGAAKEGALRARRRANPAEVWGTMPPAARQRILQALRDNFPSRYRQLVEQYYEELAKKP